MELVAGALLTVWGGVVAGVAALYLFPYRAVVRREKGERRRLMGTTRVLYLTMNDAQTCPQCAGLDGREVAYMSEEFQHLSPPLSSSPRGPGCSSEQGCRCEWLILYPESAPPGDG